MLPSHPTTRGLAPRLQATLSCPSTRSFVREILPEALQALVPAEQRREDRRIRQENVPRSFVNRRHPQEHVELAVAGLNEGVRPGHIDRLPCQDMDGFWIVCRNRVMREVHVKDERLDPPSQPRVSRSPVIESGTVLMVPRREVAQRFDLFGKRFLLGDHVVQTEDHQRIGVSEYAFV